MRTIIAPLASLTLLLSSFALLRPSGVEPPPGEVVPDPAPPVGAPAAVIGDAAASRRIVIFSDFECPACAMLATNLDSLVRDAAQPIAIEFRHFPLSSIHPWAVKAAIAAECASMQGRFKPFHDGLFANRTRLSDAAFVRIAGETGVADSSAFKACLRDPAMTARVQSDRAAGERLGIEGTPAVILGGRLYRGAVPAARLRQLLARTG